MTKRLDRTAASAPSEVSALAHDGDWLSVTWADGAQSRYPAVWLRDNVPEGRRGAEGQRLFDIATLPMHIELADAVLSEAGRIALSFAPEALAAEFEPAWLYARRLDEAARAARRGAPAAWDHRLAEALPAADYAAVRGDETALARWLGWVRDHGFALLRGVPPEPGRLPEVVALFGYLRETNYGRLFDVVSQEAPSNLAFTGLGLGLHTDNPYREPVPGLQLLHCLEASEAGGESLVADGFRAAERLRDGWPQDFALLTRYAVPFRYVEPGVDLASEAPLIEADWDGRLRAVRYNNRSAAPFDLPAEVLPAFYRAYRRFGRLLHDPEGLVAFRMRPGDLFIVDNRRVLHGRRAFGAGRRRLQGCYADKDSLLSTLRVLEAGA